MAVINDKFRKLQSQANDNFHHHSSYLGGGVSGGALSSGLQSGLSRSLVCEMTPRSNQV